MIYKKNTYWPTTLNKITRFFFFFLIFRITKESSHQLLLPLLFLPRSPSIITLFLYSSESKSKSTSVFNFVFASSSSFTFTTPLFLKRGIKYNHAEVQRMAQKRPQNIIITNVTTSTDIPTIGSYQPLAFWRFFVVVCFCVANDSLRSCRFGRVGVDLPCSRVSSVIALFLGPCLV